MSYDYKWISYLTEVVQGSPVVAHVFWHIHFSWFQFDLTTNVSQKHTSLHQKVNKHELYKMQKLK